MTDDEMILALADSLPAGEIAWKVERPLSYVLKVLTSRTKRYRKRLSHGEIMLAAGSRTFTVYRLADALDTDSASLRTRLHGMEKAGLVRRVGRQDKKTLWQVVGEE